MVVSAVNPLISGRTIKGLRKLNERRLNDWCTIIDRLEDEENSMGGVRPGDLLVRTRRCWVSPHRRVTGTERSANGEPVQSSSLWDVGFEYGEILYSTSVIEAHAGFTGALEFTVDVATNRLVFPDDHYLEQDQRVSVTSLPEGGLPAPLVERAVYYANLVDDDRITLSLTEGGAAIDLTTAGSGTLYLVKRRPLEVISLEDGATIQVGTKAVCVDRGAPGEV